MKRYALTNIPVQSTEGCWVRFDDHHAEIAAFKTINEAQADQIGQAYDAANHLEAQVAELTAENERLKLEVVRGHHVHGSCSMLAARCNALEAERDSSRGQLVRYQNAATALRVQTEVERDAALAQVAELKAALSSMLLTHEGIDLMCECMRCFVAREALAKNPGAP